MENINQYRNQVFTQLWTQAVNGRYDRRLCCAQNNQGRRAIKFKTNGFQKALILEANQRPGFEVRLCEFVPRLGLINSQGTVTFANPVETETLAVLISQVDGWAKAYETLYGQQGTVIPSSSEAVDVAQEATDSEVMDSVNDLQTESEGNVESQSAADGETNYSNWDQVEVSKVPSQTE